MKKKTKDQVVRDERLALAAKALLVPDPSPRPQETHDLINWRAVMESPVQDVVECIKCRGMHFMLAARIQRVLRRVQREPRVSAKRPHGRGARLFAIHGRLRRENGELHSTPGALPRGLPG